MDDDFRKAALDYHRHPRPGKLSVEATKRMETQRDLALAYSPGVAAACEAIVADPHSADLYTARANLVGVVTNGTAVLGLGKIGALASKPVMEGKVVLFRKFAGLDAFDIEVDANDPERFCNAVAALEPTFGGINLEDIKAPECFAIEAELRRRMNIPVFHDDQHGTAIVCAAAVRNALLLQGKKIGDVRLVTSGAGAAALACVDLLVAMGLPVANVTLTDIDGVIHAGREGMLPNMARYARTTDARTLAEVVAGADIFLGLSAPGVFKPEWLPLLADKPLLLAMANPDPEILPELVRAARPDAIVATGRSDYPNQVNNVLCFPYMFRGALDVGATEINEAMKVAAVEAIAALARATPEETVANAYGGEQLIFGADHIIPKPFDPRLILEVAPAVAKAAGDSGVARRPIEDIEAYRASLARFSYRSVQLMMPVFEAARRGEPRRIAYADGEAQRVLRAAQTVVDERLARPVLIGRRAAIEAGRDALGLRFRIGEDVEVVDPTTDDALFDALGGEYAAIVDRRGVPPAEAVKRLKRRSTITAAMLLRAGHVDAALGGGPGDWWSDMKMVLQVIPRAKGVARTYALTALITPHSTLFFCDTHLMVDPDAGQLAEMTLLAADQVRRFGITPKVALVSHSNFGASNSPSARKMRDALKLIRLRAPDLEADGEMHADFAINPVLRGQAVTASPLTGTANLLVMPSLDAANISLTLLSSVTGGLAVGPMLLGLSKPVHVLVPATTTRGIVNMTAFAVARG
ncbi:NADP-dependent malic enzyme [Sphingomonas flavalba]|uniref:NADP-dependent malic enzyme n=1 Tax=Sphingomonas flavalba TaxID=2559804 RepID=UPI0039E128B7